MAPRKKKTKLVEPVTDEVTGSTSQAASDETNSDTPTSDEVMVDVAPADAVPEVATADVVSTHMEAAPTSTAEPTPPINLDQQTTPITHGEFLMSIGVKSRPGNLPHIEWLDLGGNGIYIESAIIKRDPLGNVFYIPINALDNVDKTRLVNILMDRHAGSHELWDLMATKTINNGMNALTYFHQMVKQITPGGQIINPQTGRIGVGAQQTGEVQVTPPIQGV